VLPERLGGHQVPLTCEQCECASVCVCECAKDPNGVFVRFSQKRMHVLYAAEKITHHSILFSSFD